MNEITAMQVASRDLSRDLQRVQRAPTPTQVLDVIFNRMLHRIQQLDEGQGVVAAKKAIEETSESTMLSEHIAKTTFFIIEEVSKVLSPEDTTALIVWSMGEGQIPGFITGVLSEIPDSATEESMKQMAEQVGGIRQRLDHVDQRLFNEKLGELPSSQRKLVKGLLMQAQWCTAEEDGEGSRRKIIMARKLSERLLRNHIRSQKLFY